MTNKDLADLIFPNITKTIKDYENIYIISRNFILKNILFCSVTIDVTPPI